VGLFGRRANTYVKATYGPVAMESPTVVYDPSAPFTFSRVQFDFVLTGTNSLLFEVFDRDAVDSKVDFAPSSPSHAFQIGPCLTNSSFLSSATLRHLRCGRFLGTPPLPVRPLSHPLSLP